MPSVRRRWIVAGAGLTAAAVGAAVLVLALHGHSTSVPGGTRPQGSSPAPGGSSAPVETPAGPLVTASCTNSPTNDTPALQSAITSAEHQRVGVYIGPGTCALNTNLVVDSAVIVSGAGATATFLVQQSHKDIFDINGDNVTVENLNLDTATYNLSAPVRKNPNPPVLYSRANNTTVRDVTAEAGSGFGMRITGPQPCYTRVNGGAVVSNVTVTNSGTGGFAAVDIDCQNHASLSNITIHGSIISIYRDSNLTLTGEQFTPGPRAKTCAPPWFITSDPVASSQNISIAGVSSAGGRGVVHGAVTNLVVTTQNVTGPGCA